MPDPTRADTSHGIDLDAVAWVAAALFGTVLVAGAGAYLVWRNASSTPRLLAPNAPADVRVSGVALESAPSSGRVSYVAEKERLLHAREWIDTDAGVARLPIEVAMRVLAQRDAARRAAAQGPRPAQ